MRRSRKREKRPVSGWMFWRKAFWTRPALLLGYAVLAGSLGLGCLVAVPGLVVDAFAMRSAPECPSGPVRAEPGNDAPEGCLERVPVRLSGPWYSRGPGSDWHLLVERDGRWVFYDEVGVSTTGSSRLKGLGEDPAVDVLYWEGTPVLVEPGNGTAVETDQWGHRGWVMWLLIGAFAVAGSLMLVQVGLLKRRTTDGWWSVHGDPIGLVPELTPLMQVACVFAVPAMLGLLPFAIGLHLGIVAAAALLGLALVAFGIVKQRKRLARERAAPA